MKLFTIIGARPQFIKAAVVSRTLAEHRSNVCEILVHTGQHYDSNMSEVFFDDLNIPRPDYNLGVGGGSHGQNTGRMLEKLEALMLRERPDWVLVYGDTDSTLAGALAAAKLHIPVAHVEAGLRSFNRRMPEEINRVLTDHTAVKLFAPTTTAVKNLVAEGITGSRVHNVGDVMYDAALYYGDKAERNSVIFSQLDLLPKAYILATLHRQENVDEKNRLTNIFEAFSTSEKPIIMPLHPRTRKRLIEFSIDIPATVKIIDPVGYLDMVMLEKHASMIATDSGGVQKEAYFHKVPCITLRDETEWVELVECGANHLVGANKDLIRSKMQNVHISNYNDYMPYGQGDAGVNIVRCLLT